MALNEKTIPVFPLPKVVLFPSMNLPLHIFEERYKQMLNYCIDGNKPFAIVQLLDDEILKIGTIAEIVDVEIFDNGEANILVEGKDRIEIDNLFEEEPYFTASYTLYEDLKKEKISQKKIEELKKTSKKVMKLFDNAYEQELSKKIKLPSDINELLFLLAANLTCPTDEKQFVLETRSVLSRFEKIESLLNDEFERLNILVENKKTKPIVSTNGKLHN